MEIKRFLKLVKKYLWILILLPVIAATVTYFLSKNIPKQYVSEAQISTGLVDQSKQLLNQTPNDYFKTNQQFSNIIEKMKMRKIMSILSYNLIIHDLENPQKPFKKYSDKLDSLSASQKGEVIALFKQKLIQKTPATVYDNKGKYKLYDILSSMGYDEVGFTKNLNISHPDNSDFVNIQYESENPLLSVYVVNTLASVFISNYEVDVNTNQNNSIAVLDSLLKKKEAAMNAKNDNLKNFKMKNGVLNLDEQSASVYAKITDYQEKKSQAIESIQANQGALAAINSKLQGVGDSYSDANTMKDNGRIIALKNQLKVANDRYIDGGFKAGDKRRVDSLQTLVSNQTMRNSDNNVVDPLVAKQGLIQQRSALEISTAQIKNTIGAIDKQLAVLKAQYSTMVPFDAGIQNFERDAEVATKDYMTALDRTNQSRTEQNSGLKLEVAQVGLPGTAQPSKAIIFVGLSGVGTFAACFAVLVILFLLDSSIYTVAQLAAATKSPVIGSLNAIKTSGADVKSVWNNKDNASYGIHKDLLRSLRFEISTLLASDNSKILGITSLIGGEGKTYIASNLAYAYAMAGKKILLIGGDKSDDQVAISTATSPTSAVTESKQLRVSQNFETFLVKKEIQVHDLITRLNKIDEDRSLLEIQSERNLRSGFDVLKNQFDIIIIDINSLSNINLAKEWLSFTDKNIAIFEAGKSITDSDKSLIKLLKEQKGFLGWVINKVKLDGVKD
jgi:succinoglycan biosynthesis transport protein ExoP